MHIALFYGSFHTKTHIIVSNGLFRIRNAGKRCHLMWINLSSFLEYVNLKRMIIQNEKERHEMAESVPSWIRLPSDETKMCGEPYSNLSQASIDFQAIYPISSAHFFQVHAEIAFVANWNSYFIDIMRHLLS